MSQIPEHLVQKIQELPARPGIYQMKDASGEIMYVGKSKSLKSRVKSYFSSQEKSNKIEKMIFHIHDIDYIVTDTHLEAQLLECALIKKLKPIYNVQFKNHENYKYLKVEEYNKFRPLKVVGERLVINCFGPYRNKRILLELEPFFRNVYPILKCEGKYQFSYKIFPETMNRATFEENKQCLIEILSKEKCRLEFLTQLENKMKEAALELQFETASLYKDLLEHIMYLHQVSVNKAKRSLNKRLLLAEKLEVGYKLFYIFHEKVIFKKKYIRMTPKILESFFREAQMLEVKHMPQEDEKSDLDFQHILYKELQDTNFKFVFSLDDEYDLEELVNGIKSL